MTTGLHDRRSYAHCVPLILPQEIDFNVAVAAPFPIPLCRHGHATVTILSAWLQLTQDMSVSSAAVKIGKPGDNDYYLSYTVRSWYTAGLYRMDITGTADIARGELVEVTYVANSGNGRGRVILNVGEARSAG